MDKPDIATIIDSHFEEMTDLEQEIARYFLQSETIADNFIFSAGHSKITYLSSSSDPLC